MAIDTIQHLTRPDGMLGDALCHWPWCSRRGAGDAARSGSRHYRATDPCGYTIDMRDLTFGRDTSTLKLFRFAPCRAIILTARRSSRDVTSLYFETVDWATSTRLRRR
jgi:hypothetical protein